MQLVASFEHDLYLYFGFCYQITRAKQWLCHMVYLLGCLIEIYFTDYTSLFLYQILPIACGLLDLVAKRFERSWWHQILCIQVLVQHLLISNIEDIFL